MTILVPFKTQSKLSYSSKCNYEDVNRLEYQILTDSNELGLKCKGKLFRFNRFILLASIGLKLIELFS